MKQAPWRCIWGLDEADLDGHLVVEPLFNVLAEGRASAGDVREGGLDAIFGAVGISLYAFVPELQIITIVDDSLEEDRIWSLEKVCVDRVE